MQTYVGGSIRKFWGSLIKDAHKGCKTLVKNIIVHLHE